MKSHIALGHFALSLALLASLSACNPLPNSFPEPSPDPSPTPFVEETPEYTLYVNSQKVECVGVGPQQCLQVRRSEDQSWSFFYDEIVGFTFEPGFVYTLIVREENVENPPADASSKRFILQEVVSKSPSEAIAATE